MRLLLQFELENERLDIQYRKAIISWIKKSIQTYDENLYLQLYKDKDPITKTFTFAPALGQAKFLKDEILLNNNSIRIMFSFYNYAYALHLYNAFCGQKNQKFPLQKNAMKLKKVVVLPEKKIDANKIIVKTASPIISRQHSQETKKDWYFSFENEEFEEQLKINIAGQMKAEGLDTSLLKDFSIKAIQAKKVIIPLYEKKIETSLGIFEIQGNEKLLDYIYKAGLGSKKAMRFWLVRNFIERRKKWKNLELHSMIFYLIVVY